MKNIHVLPTDKPSRLYLTTKEYVFEEVNLVSTDECQNKHIYITSDEEIKEGDWYINTFVSEREQKPQTHTEKRHIINHQKDYRFKYCKKIILTTDQDLINDGVQAIDDEFLEWFVKNPSCEEIEVEKLPYDGTKSITKYWGGEYKITIPKEEPKKKQKKMYSDEEVEDILEHYDRDFKLDTFSYTKSYSFTVKEWFEKFKNK